MRVGDCGSEPASTALELPVLHVLLQRWRREGTATAREIEEGTNLTDDQDYLPPLNPHHLEEYH